MFPDVLLLSMPTEDDGREGVFDDFDPVDVGETNAVAAERDFGTE
ncbi:hypothetical protein [Halorubellus sp. JP-L1]|nr:hypothetical protein [Halorubellus sp. JP-L1]